MNDHYHPPPHMDEGINNQGIALLDGAGHREDVGRHVPRDSLHRFLADAGVRVPNQDAVMQRQCGDPSDTRVVNTRTMISLSVCIRWNSKPFPMQSAMSGWRSINALLNLARVHPLGSS
jgi:hypothetical protein